MASRRTWSRYTVSSIGSMNRKLSRPFFGRTLFAGTFRYSSESGTSRSPGAIQCPTTAGPIMSAMNSYSLPFHEKRTGQELPRRSSSLMRWTLPAWRFTSSCGTPFGHKRRTTSVAFSLPRPAISVGEFWEVARRAGSFPFLVKPSGENLHFGADSVFVVIQALEVDLNPIVFVGADIFEQDGSASRLGNNQVGASIASQISYRDSRRLA